MDDIKRAISYIKNNKKQELMELINCYIEDIKTNLHEDNPEQSKLKELRTLSEQSGRIAASISECAKKSNERYLFNGGYLASLVEELRLYVDKLESVNECEIIYKKNIGKRHWGDIVQLLYKQDIVQNKTISHELSIPTNYLNKIMNEMLENRCVVVYAFSKYKYYSLSWQFKKYLDSINYSKKNYMGEKYCFLGEKNKKNYNVEWIYDNYIVHTSGCKHLPKPARTQYFESTVEWSIFSYENGKMAYDLIEKYQNVCYEKRIKKGDMVLNTIHKNNENVIDEYCVDNINKYFYLEENLLLDGKEDFFR